MRTVAVVEAKSQFSALLSLTATIGGIGGCPLFPYSHPTSRLRKLSNGYLEAYPWNGARSEIFIALL